MGSEPPPPPCWTCKTLTPPLARLRSAQVAAAASEGFEPLLFFPGPGARPLGDFLGCRQAAARAATFGNPPNDPATTGGDDLGDLPNCLAAGGSGAPTTTTTTSSGAPVAAVGGSAGTASPAPPVALPGPRPPLSTPWRGPGSGRRKFLVIFLDGTWHQVGLSGSEGPSSPTFQKLCRHCGAGLWCKN